MAKNSNLVSMAQTIKELSAELTGLAKADFDAAVKKRLLEADERCNRYLADANEAEEAGDKKRAEKLYEKSGFWRNRYNQLAGNS